jgi:hypothetical protein
MAESLGRFLRISLARQLDIDSVGHELMAGFGKIEEWGGDGPRGFGSRSLCGL